MEVQCADVIDEGCGVVVSGRSADHLAEEIVAHTGHAHPNVTERMSVTELAAHRADLVRRLNDMLAGGPGTPV